MNKILDYAVQETKVKLLKFKRNAFWIADKIYFSLHFEFSSHTEIKINSMLPMFYRTVKYQNT